MIVLQKSPINGYTCPDDPGEPIRNDSRMSVNDIEAEILSEFARGKNVLEIGTGLGVSTRKMAETANLVYTVDIDPWVKDKVAPTLPENVRFFTSLDDYGIMPGFDMALIDGFHSCDQCVKDARAVKKLVKPGGIIIFHDFRLPSISRAIAISGLDVVFIATTAGLGLAWNKGVNQ